MKILSRIKTRRLGRFVLSLLLLGVAVCFSARNSAIAADAVSETPSAILELGGEIKSPLKLTQADLAAMPRIKITAKDKGGADVAFEGVELAEILKRAGAPLGDQLRGPALALAVIITAADHYQAVFALSELDPGMTDKKVILADTADGKPLALGVGPFRLVVPDDKRHARWVRMVTRIDIVRVNARTFGADAAPKQ